MLPLSNCISTSLYFMAIKLLQRKRKVIWTINSMRRHIVLQAKHGIQIWREFLSAIKTSPHLHHILNQAWRMELAPTSAHHGTSFWTKRIQAQHMHWFIWDKFLGIWPLLHAYLIVGIFVNLVLVLIIIFSFHKAPLDASLRILEVIPVIQIHLVHKWPRYELKNP
jgi:hypothetical protein